MEVNGKHYLLWGQFVEKRNKFIGGILEDSGDKIDRVLFGVQPIQTKIKDIVLEPNSTDSAMFSIIGENFSCGFDVKYGGIINGEMGWITFAGYGGHTFRIKENEQK